MGNQYKHASAQHAKAQQAQHTQHTAGTTAQNVAKITPIISYDVALLEFERFSECMDLFVDVEVMDDEDRAAFEKYKGRLVRSIESGHLVINDNGEAVYTPHNKNSKRQESITFYEQDGAALMAIDGKKKNANVASTFAVMASMCKVHPSTFAGLVGIDIKVCMAVYLLLMD